MADTLEVEPTAIAQLTGRMGAITTERRGTTWHGELMASGKMGAVTRNGQPADDVPEWFQRKMARATATLQRASGIVPG